MDAIMNFLEQYWGYTIFGGISLGTIITFTVTQIKALVKNKTNNQNIKDALDKAEGLCLELKQRNDEQTQTINQLTTRIEKQQREMAERNAYFEQIQTATFQALSYLAIASKLPTEDKIALQQKFTSILEHKTVQYKEMLQDEVQALTDEITDNIIPDVQETIKTTVEETKSLLDKYTDEE